MRFPLFLLSSTLYCIAPLLVLVVCILPMAVKLDSVGTRAAPRADEAEVSSCVAGIIEAFTNGFNIFKRLRERRKKRKSSRKDSDTSDATSSAEHQLSKSLRRGPIEVAEKYVECYQSSIGARFAKGDGEY